MSGIKPTPSRVLLGLIRVARFRPDGVAQFGATPGDYLNSLAPLIALPLVGGLLMAVQGSAGGGLTYFLGTLVALLLPAVISEWMARRWRCGESWLRYAVAFNWCQWLMPLALLAGLLLSEGFVVAGLSIDAAAESVLIGVLVYMFVLHWFLARNALGLGRLKSLALTVMTDFGAALVILIPFLVDAGLNGAAESP